MHLNYLHPLIFIHCILIILDKAPWPKKNCKLQHYFIYIDSTNDIYISKIK
jgi:hypothetical protein